MAKKVLMVLVLAAFIAVGGVFAQDQSGLDFSSTAPQFFSFDLGAGVGFSLDSSHSSPVKGVTVAGFKVAVIDNLEVGIETLSAFSLTLPPAFVGLRVSYRFTPVLGAAIGLGAAAVQSTTTTAAPGISLGVFYDLFASRSKTGIATALKVRLDYVAETDNVAKGVLLFSPVFTIGL